MYKINISLTAAALFVITFSASITFAGELSAQIKRIN